MSTDVTPTSSAKPIGIRADNPIAAESEDTLGRSELASSFADQIFTLDASQGMVVGVLGPWGSGKTSFVNLCRLHLSRAGVTVLDFNPWMFSGADQLVQTFFVELSAQLKLHPALAAVGERLQDYGETFSGLGWLPVVGPWMERVRGAMKILGALLQRRRQGINEGQAKVRRVLLKLTKPIVVVVDDIDRLTTPEIRDIFKLVRLTASFPNVIYLLAFDRARVEQALNEQQIPGRAYLEKILQIGYDLPDVPVSVLITQTTQAIDAALACTLDAGPFDSDLWPDVLMEVIAPLIGSVRDVRRYAAAIHGTVNSVGKNVALVDVLALEAVRTFLPDVFSNMHSAIAALTGAGRSYGDHSEDAKLREKVEKLVNVAGDRAEVIRDLIRRLFPAGARYIGGMTYGSDWGNRWLRERRVAHEAVLRYYLERVAGDELRAFFDAENAWTKMADQADLKAYLEALPPERIEDIVPYLEAYEDEFSPDQVVPASVVLLNLLPALPERQRSMFDLGARLAVSRVVYRLVRSLQQPDLVAAAVSQILQQVASLSSKLELISTIGYHENVGHKLVSEADAERFEREWRASVRTASSAALAQEADLLRTFWVVKEQADPNEPPLIIPDSPEVTLALLKSARSEARSQSMGSRAIRHKPRLAWDALVDLYGNEDTVRERIDALKRPQSGEIVDLLALADKYLGGWRPKGFGDD